MKPALFLDRDGIINVENGYITSVDAFIWQPEILPLLRIAIKKTFLLIIITNQGGIAQKLYTENTLKQIHQRMLMIFQQQQIHITAVYSCPHHPHIGNCLCRKPATLLFQRAAARHNIDLANSWMIGDRERDIQPAIALKMKTIYFAAEPTELPVSFQTTSFEETAAFFDYHT
jgi:D-glycero-D-manno-heptose 1,7-bisphosphate phosphatase